MSKSEEKEKKVSVDGGGRSLSPEGRGRWVGSAKGDARKTVANDILWTSLLRPHFVGFAWNEKFILNCKT